MITKNLGRLAFFSALVALAAAAFCGPALGQPVRTYTSEADFNEGALFNTSIVEEAGDDKVQLNLDVSAFPLLWVANAGEDTISKLDTDTGKELARYRTWFGPAGQPGHFSHINNPWAGPAPSRTAIDSNANCYVANRHFRGGFPPSICKILVNSFIDRNGNGVVDTSTDVNNNGVIDPAEILPLADSNGNNMVDDNEIQDERIAWIKTIGTNGNGLGRSLSIDNNGILWLGQYNDRSYLKVNSSDGSLVPPGTPISTGSHSPYGSIVDSAGTLWGASLTNNMLELNTNTSTVVAVRTHAGSNYGIAIANGMVYLARAGSPFRRYNPGTTTFDAPNPDSLSLSSLGIAADSNGDIFVGDGNGGGGSNGMTKVRPDGQLVWTQSNQGGTGEVRGAQVDSGNNGWAIHRTTQNVSKFDGATGAPLGVFPVGNQPYTYSDATGLQNIQSNPTGSWTVIHDGGIAGFDWGLIACTLVLPVDTSANLDVRAAETIPGLGGELFQPIDNNQSFCGTGILGRYIEIKVTLGRDANSTNLPQLCDLTVTACPVTPDDLACRAKPTKCDLTWSNTPGAESYNIYRRVTGDPNFAFVANQAAFPNNPNVYVDTPLTNGVSYDWYITSVIGALESDPSNEVTCTVPAGRRRR